MKNVVPETGIPFKTQRHVPAGRHTLIDVDILTGDYHINKKLYEAMKKSKP